MFPNKENVSKLNLRDNALRFKTEMKNGQRKKEGRDENEIDDNTNNENTTTVINNNAEWTLEMNKNLAKIDRAEKKKGKVFMKRIKES